MPQKVDFEFEFVYSGCQMLMFVDGSEFSEELFRTWRLSKENSLDYGDLGRACPQPEKSSRSKSAQSITWSEFVPL